jgi:RNA polymerase sigma-70 factor (ECF subfamily)
MRGGNTAALDQLFVRHSGRLYAFLVRWTGDAAAAEDLVQDLFLKLLQLPGPSLTGEVLPWLYSVARNMAIDRFRQRQAASPLPLDHDIRDRQPLALERLTREEQARQLEAVLAALPHHHREVLLLRAIDGLGHQQIGAVINCSEGAARVRLHRATMAFRQTWQLLHGVDQ